MTAAKNVEHPVYYIYCCSNRRDDDEDSRPSLLSFSTLLIFRRDRLSGATSCYYIRFQLYGAGAWWTTRHFLKQLASSFSRAQYSIKRYAFITTTTTTRQKLSFHNMPAPSPPSLRPVKKSRPHISSPPPLHPAIPHTVTRECAHFPQFFFCFGLKILFVSRHVGITYLYSVKLFKS